MPLTVTCPNCGYENPIDDEDDDRPSRVFCGSCGIAVEVPEPAEAPAPSSARVKWRYPDVPVPAAQPLRNSPAVDAAGRLFACLQNEVVALAVEDDRPQLLWSYPTGGFIPGSPALGPDGGLRVHSSDGFLHCLDDQGRPKWPPVRVGDALGWAAPLVDAAGNTYICGYNGGLWKIDASGAMGGRPIYRCPGKFDCTGLVGDGTVYAGAEDHFVHAVDVTAGRGRNRWNQAENRGRTEWYINSALAWAEGPAIVAAGRDDCLYGFGPDGELLWKTPLPGQILSSPVVDGENRVFIGLSLSERGRPARGFLACVDAKSQRLLWRYEAGGPVESVPVIGADGVVYFGDNAGWIHAVDAAGQAVWTEQAGIPVRSAGALTRTGRVVFGLDDGTLVALECDSPGLSPGWPKYLGGWEQSGQVPR